MWKETTTIPFNKRLDCDHQKAFPLISIISTMTKLTYPPTSILVTFSIHTRSRLNFKMITTAMNDGQSNLLKRLNSIPPRHHSFLEIRELKNSPAPQ